jgi:thiol-disulfide isomerase/thioredoxin
MVIMLGKKQFDLGMIITALIISSLLFISGIFVGYSINQEKLSSIEKTIKEIISDIQNFQLQFLFIDILGENGTCPFLMDTLYEINKKSYEIGLKLESYGKESEIKDYNEFLTQKREYSRLLINYWLLSNKLKKSCKTDFNTIVYFYSRECERCDDQAFILTYLKKTHGEKVLVFALDGDLDEPSIKVLKINYNITSYPYLIVNEKGFAQFMSKNDLESLLNLNII